MQRKKTNMEKANIAQFIALTGDPYADVGGYAIQELAERSPDKCEQPKRKTK